jgi:Domain of unknown function (DUF4157)
VIRQMTTRASPPSKDTADVVPSRGRLLQRKCACGAGASGHTNECAECSEKIGLQKKLRINESGDAYEQEADRVADQVTKRMHPDLGGAPPHLQRFSGQSDGQMAAAPASVEHALSDPGKPLESPLRQEMERRFGHDFSRVRVHCGSAAEQSTRDVNANAYTVGHDIAFAAGNYAPSTHVGRRLIAHELAHVVQQRASPPMVQRDDKSAGKPKEESTAKSKIDVSIVLSDDDKDEAEGGAYAKTVLRVYDAEDAAKKLKALGAQIGRLYVISHSTKQGKVQFVSKAGTISWVTLTDFGRELKGAASIDAVDFRGCKVGEAGGELESFREKVGAQSTRGTTCSTFAQRVTPLTLNGVDVTTPSQIPKGRQNDFDKALLDQINGLKSADGKPVKNCLIGLAPGETADAKNLSKIWKLYWANQGRLVAEWASPELDENWQQGSICTKDMTTSTKPCAIVEKKAP